MKLLVIHPGALGDLILSLPALDGLRAAFPGTRLTVAGNEAFLEALAWDRAAALRSISSLPMHRLFVGQPLENAELLFWRSFDRIVSWTGWGDATFAHSLEAAHPSVLIAGWRPEPWDARHVSRIFQESLRPWVSFRDAPAVSRVCPRPEQVSAAREFLGLRVPDSRDRYVALHPGAGAAWKRWPIEHFARLGELLLERDSVRLLLVEGPADEGIARSLALSFPDDRVKIATGFSLPFLAGLLFHCRGFVGNDSGITHLAAGLGLPVVAIFGPTNPLNWAPLGERVAVIREPQACPACCGYGSRVHECLDAIVPAVVMKAGEKIGAW